MYIYIYTALHARVCAGPRLRDTRAPGLHRLGCAARRAAAAGKHAAHDCGLH